MAEHADSRSAAAPGTPAEVLAAFFALGLRSFGGPVAHLGYFRAEFVAKRRWVDEATFADLIALTQLLPGPGSSELGMALGNLRAGFWGAAAAWLGFTTPSAVLMVLFGYGVTRLGDIAGAPWLHGLTIVAVAVVAQAVWGMARSLAPDRPRMTLAVAAAAIALTFPGTAGQLGAIALGAITGFFLPAPERQDAPPPVARSHYAGAWTALAIFAVLLVGLPLVADATGALPLKVAASFYRSGSLVFGGGHVLLPLLQASVVLPGWVGNETFLAGYGAAQALPGPVFTFSAFLGTAIGGVLYAAIALVAVFLPGFLLVVGTLPFMSAFRGNALYGKALRGVNAAVVGLVLAALYTPVWTSAITSARDFVLALVAFLLLLFWRVPPWLVVFLGAVAAETVSRFS
ncbi:MAG TPA: chromate efflux transporter [Stellaceae bacterium]|nr:chromate efflux transporter [Stellaceae bacterium]